MPRRPSAGNISSTYGPRVHPITGKHQGLHTGEDIGYTAGITLVAPLDCKVTSYARAGGYGMKMTLVGYDRIGRRIEVWLCHLAGANVWVGFEAPEGFHVANMGMSGTATGVHVHWEVRIDGIRVDPADWLTSAAALDIILLPEEEEDDPKEEEEAMLLLITINDGEGRYGPVGTSYWAVTGPNYWWGPIATKEAADTLSVRLGNVSAANVTYAEWEAAERAGRGS